MVYMQLILVSKNLRGFKSPKLFVRRLSQHISPLGPETQPWWPAVRSHCPCELHPKWTAPKGMGLTSVNNDMIMNASITQSFPFGSPKDWILDKSSINIDIVSVFWNLKWMSSIYPSGWPRAVPPSWKGGCWASTLLHVCPFCCYSCVTLQEVASSAGWKRVPFGGCPQNLVGYWLTALCVIPKEQRLLFTQTGHFPGTPSLLMDRIWAWSIIWLLLCCFTSEKPSWRFATSTLFSTTSS